MVHGRQRPALCGHARDRRRSWGNAAREPGDGRAYQEAREGHGESDLLDELVKSPPAIDPDRVREAGGNIGTVASEQLHDAVAILEAKATPSEVDDYKRFVMTVAQVVASAHKEGGFLGIGAKQISDAENEALDEIAAALGTPPAT